MLRLHGAVALVVEDEFFVAEAVRECIETAGGGTVHAVPTVRAALELLSVCWVDIAVLDVDLVDETSLPVAEMLGRLGIPFVFFTGRDVEHLPKAFQVQRVVRKPLHHQLVEALVELWSVGR